MPTPVSPVKIERRKGQPFLRESSFFEAPPHVPLLLLDEEGMIQTATRAARGILEYPSDGSIEPCFFSHVHGRNLRRVMRDLAHMVCQRMHRARWLLRLRTGKGRWRWYRAEVESQLDRPDGRIQVRLHPL